LKVTAILIALDQSELGALTMESRNKDSIVDAEKAKHNVFLLVGARKVI